MLFTLDIVWRMLGSRETASIRQLLSNMVVEQWLVIFPPQQLFPLYQHSAQYLYHFKLFCVWKKNLVWKNAFL